MDITTLASSEGSAEVVRQPTHDIGVIVGTLGILLNLLFIAILVRRSFFLNPVTTRILINQSAIDFCSGVFLILMQYHSLHVGSHIPTNIGLPHIYCVAIWSGMIVWSLFTSSTFNLCTLALDRYMSVGHPGIHQTRFTKSTITRLNIAVWMLGFVWQGAQHIYHLHYEDTSRSCVWKAGNPTTNIFFIVANALMLYIIPVSLLLLCYGRIVLILRHQVSNVEVQGRSNEIGKVRKLKARRFIYACLIVSATFLICYSCNIIYFTLGALGLVTIDWEGTFYHFSVQMVFVNCFINPVIYLIGIKDFRREAIKLLTLGQVKQNYDEDEVTNVATTLNMSLIDDLV